MFLFYYIREFGEGTDTGAVIIEIATDRPESPGPEFRETTHDELIEKGYLLTPPTIAFTDCSFGHSSDIMRTFIGGSTSRKKVTCQSETNRTYTLGYNRAIGRTYRNGTLVNEVDTGWRYGLWIRATYVWTWTGPNFWWEQRGFHYWQSNFPISEGRSSASANFKT
jgi:hypothetical protein